MKKEALSILLIVILGFAVYANSLKGPFLWDDKDLVEANSFIRSGRFLPKIFTGDIGEGSGKEAHFYRPLQIVSYLLDYRLWGLDVAGYHLTNTLLHILVAVLIYLLFGRLFSDRLLSLATSILFLVHPVHSEAVAYISGRADPLAAVFILLSFIFYLNFLDLKKGSTCFFLFFFYAAALLSKEVSLIFPLVIVFYHYAFKKEAAVKIIAGLVVLAAAYIVLRLTFLKAFLPGSPAEATTLAQRLPGVFAAFAAYLRLLIFPLGLHMEYGSPRFCWFEPSVAAGIGAIGLSIWFLRKRRDSLFIFAAGWFFLWILPQANLYPINAYMAEHWLYLPSIGFFLILAWGFKRLFAKKKLKVFALVLFIALAAFFSFFTLRQNRSWSDPVSFYKETLASAPESASVYNNLGNLYFDQGKYSQAIASFNKAIELDGTEAFQYYNLANAYNLSSQTDKAVSAYKKAIGVDPGYAKAYEGLATLYKDKGQVRQAVAYYKQAIELDPQYAEAYYGLGNAYRLLKQDQEAIEAFEQAIELDPYDTQAYNNLGNAYQSLGQLEFAIQTYLKAIEVTPEPARVYNNLGTAYYLKGDYNKAVASYEKAVEIDPSYGAAHSNLAVFYFSAGQYPLAIQHCDKALSFGYEVPLGLLKKLKAYR